MQPITLLDFAPTLLEACGLPIPDAMQGRKLHEAASCAELSNNHVLGSLVLPQQDSNLRAGSIMPLIQRRGEDWPEESFIQISEAQVGRAVRTARWKYGVDAPFKQGWQDSEEEGWLEPAGSASMKYEEQYLCALATLLSCPLSFAAAVGCHVNGCRCAAQMTCKPTRTSCAIWSAIRATHMSRT